MRSSSTRPPDEITRLRHILDACNEVRAFIDGKTRPALDGDRILLLALVKEIEIIGEAANALSPGVRALAPAVPWLDVIGMRHRLVHAYDDINADVLWRTVTQDLPPFRDEIARILNELLQ